MKIWSFVLYAAVFAAIVSCDKKKSGYEPDAWLTKSEQEAILKSTVRYFAKRPDTATEESKFDSQNDKFYEAKVKETNLLFYYPAKDTYYILVSQIAPSIMGKRHATGIRFKLDDKGELTEYEEVFRTWKMLPDTLQRRGYFLFDKMVKGEPLEQYQTKNSNGTEYVEFPDDLNYYDKEARRWKTTIVLDTIPN